MRLKVAVGTKLRKINKSAPDSAWFTSSPTFVENWRKVGVGNTVTVTDVYTDQASMYDNEPVAVLTDHNGTATVVPLQFITANNFFVVA